MFVVDCSITMAWLFKDEKTALSEKIMDRLVEEKAIVPPVWTLEVLNVILIGEKRKRISISESAHFLSVLSRLPIQVIENPTLSQNESMLFLARTHHLTSYDAAYLDLAFRFEIPLATLNTQLIIAAQKIGVQILQ